MFDLHWEQENEAFFDRGLDSSSDGQLLEEVMIRCMNGASGSIGDRIDFHCQNDEG